MATNYVDDPMPLLRDVLGACSITKTVLQACDIIPPDPDERMNDHRTNLLRMRQLCTEEDIDTAPLADLESLLDLLDQFAAQDRRVTPEQVHAAEMLRQRYVAWCRNVFFDTAE